MKVQYESFNTSNPCFTTIDIDALIAAAGERFTEKKIIRISTPKGIVYEEVETRKNTYNSRRFYMIFKDMCMWLDTDDIIKIFIYLKERKFKYMDQLGKAILNCGTEEIKKWYCS